MTFKKFTAALASLALVVTSVFTFGANIAITQAAESIYDFVDYQDVSSWAVDSFNALISRGLLEGSPVEGGRALNPKASLNRAEGATITERILGLSADLQGAPHFNDVSSADWFYSTIETLYNAGIVSGINGGALDYSGLATFSPAASMNRAEFAQMLYNAFNLSYAYALPLPSFSDVGSSDWYYDVVETCAANGVITGYEGGTFGAGDTVNREQAIVMFERALKIYEGDYDSRLDGYTEGKASEYVEPEPADDGDDNGDDGGDDSTTTTPTSDGSLQVSLNADTMQSATLPKNAIAAVAAWDFTASSSGDVLLSTLIIEHKGVGSSDEVGYQVLKDGNGNRISKSKGSPNSDNETTFNLLSGGLTIPAGTTTTIQLVIEAGSDAGSTGEHYFELENAEVVVSNAQSVTGDFPLASETMTFSTTEAGELIVTHDGSIAAVNIGDVDAIIAKPNFEPSNEDVTLHSVTFKFDDPTDGNSEADPEDAIQNLALVYGGAVVATGVLNDDYVNFVLTDPVLIEENDKEKFTVTADIIGEPSRSLRLAIDSAADVVGIGSDYGFGVKVNYTEFNNGDNVKIEAGAISLVKNEPVETFRADQEDLVLGEFEIFVNAGTSIEFEKFTASITASGQADISGSGTYEAVKVSDLIENVVLSSETKGTHDLSFSTTGTTESYVVSDLGLILQNGATYKFQVRCDTKDVVYGVGTNQPTLKLAIDNIGGSGDTKFSEEIDDQTIDDVTPASLSYNTMEGILSGATLSLDPQSAIDVVIGATDVEALVLNIKPSEDSNLTLTELKVYGEVFTPAELNLTVKEVPGDNETITIGDCTVTFDDSDTSAADSDCSEGNATIDISATEIATSDVAAQLAALEGVTYTSGSADSVDLGIAYEDSTVTFKAEDLTNKDESINFTDSTKTGDETEQDITSTSSASSVGYISKEQITQVVLYDESNNMLEAVSASSSSIADGVVTFSDLSEELTAEENHKFYVKYDLTSDENQADKKITFELYSIDLEDEDSKDITAVTVGSTSVSPERIDISSQPLVSDAVVTIKGYGSLAVDYDANDDENKYAKTILAGESEYVVSFKVQAENEEIKVDDVVFTLAGASDIVGTITSADLYLGTEKVATNTSSDIAATTITFSSLGSQCQIPTQETALILKINTANIGKSDNSNSRTGSTLTGITVASVELQDAKGVNSSQAVSNVDKDTESPKEFAIVPAVLTTTLVSEFGTEAKFTVTVDSGNNTTDDNNIPTVSLNKLVFTDLGTYAEDEDHPYTLYDDDDSSNTINVSFDGDNTQFDFETEGSNWVSFSNSKDFVIRAKGTTDTTYGLKLQKQGIVYETDVNIGTSLTSNLAAELDLGDKDFN